MPLIRQIVKLLCFRLDRAEFMGFDQRHLIAGFVGTWIVGMGRYWDDSKAKMLQHLGLGSVIYIIVLSFFIWLIVKPLLIEDWSYKHVLTFIGLTSFPAILYAIPVERLFTMSTAAQINVWFLAVVAFWRLALLFYFLRFFTRLKYWIITCITLLPICLIISSLTFLNLEQAVFNIMGGIRDATANDRAYAILVGLTFTSLGALPIVAIGYIAAIVAGRGSRKK